MIELDGSNLALDQIVRAARAGEKVSISPSGLENISRSHQQLNAILQAGKPVYGINTGFGIFADRRIQPDESAKLSRNLILSHAVGTGEPFDPEVVRAAMLVRANTLAKGCSGVRRELVQSLVEMLNRGVTPVIPSQGSLGSSGDLVPLSHLGLVLTTDEDDRDDQSGLAAVGGEICSGKLAMQKAGLQRLVLGPKEGLALNNGATFTAAIGALAVVDAAYLLEVADLAAAMSLEALLGCSQAFDDRLHEARGQRGQIESARNIRFFTAGSTLLNCTSRVQDAYSLRCAPQVHGIARDALEFITAIIQREVNAATDNPLIFEPAEALSGGNFHGEPVGVVLDYLSIAISELAAISERRVNRLIDGKLNQGLPPMLVDSVEAAGLNSGLMMPQYTAAALVLENQTLATPDSVHSLPTSGEQEDHNANAMAAARHARTVIQNTTHVLAIELFTAARALILRLRSNPELVPGHGTKKALEQVMSAVPYISEDYWLEPDIDKVRQLIILKKVAF